MTRTTRVETFGHLYLNGTRVSTSSASVIRSDRDDIRTSVKSPRGWRVPLPYFAQHTEAVGPSASLQYLNVFGDKRRYSGNFKDSSFYPSFRGSPSSDAGLRSRAEVEALLNLKNQKVNLAQAFAERKQVANLFAKNITDIAQALLALKRGDLPGTFRRLRKAPRKLRGRTVPERWLELQYGWKPLLGDINGAFEAIADQQVDDFRFSVKGKCRRRWTEVLAPPDGVYSSLPTTCVDELENKVLVRLDYKPENPFLHTFTEMGFTNPLALAYELTPYSFALDWALPVGDWLNSLDAATGLVFIGGSITEVRSAYRKHMDGRMNENNYSFGVSGHGKQVTIDRKVYADSPLPTFPRFKPPWSYDHVANAMSLLALAFARRST